MNVVITSVIFLYFLYLIHSSIIYFNEEELHCQNNIEYIPIPEVVHNELKMKYN